MQLGPAAFLTNGSQFGGRGSPYIKYEKRFFKVQTSQPIRSLIYADQVAGLRVWCSQWRFYKDGPALGYTMLEGYSIFRRLSKGSPLFKFMTFFF